MKVLVAGGAGYIGSHVTRQLVEQGHKVVVYDNLSTGNRWAVLGAELVEEDLANRSALDAVFSQNQFDAVMQFAASIVVPESVAEPIKYYSNNTGNTLGLIDRMVHHGVPRLVFSSTAAVYGVPESEVVEEVTALAPINPYGASKMMSERIIMDTAQAISGFEYVILRYFNVAGADPLARIGQATPKATHLIKVACQAALGQRSHVDIFGTDYPTPDGTGIRDYMHVEDLASAHLDALSHLVDTGHSDIYNVGYGRGASVREVLRTVREVAGQDFDIREAPRRPGDPARLVADNAKISRTLGWKPRYDNLEKIVLHAWQWEQKMAQRGQGDIR